MPRITIEERGAYDIVSTEAALAGVGVDRPDSADADGAGSAEHERVHELVGRWAAVPKHAKEERERVAGVGLGVGRR